MIELMVAVMIAAGAPPNVQVSCEPKGVFQTHVDELGLPSRAYAYAWGGDNPGAVFRARTCRAADDPTSRRARSAAWDLFVTGHEAAHTRGIHSEHAADCYGYKQVKRLARLRGATRKQARHLGRLARRMAYIKQGRYGCNEPRRR